MSFIRRAYARLLYMVYVSMNIINSPCVHAPSQVGVVGVDIRAPTCRDVSTRRAKFVSWRQSYNHCCAERASSIDQAGTSVGCGLSSAGWIDRSKSIVCHRQSHTNGEFLIPLVEVVDSIRTS